MLQSHSEIPGQVMRHQPVYLEDARGVVAPFSLEFVTCAEVMNAALERLSKDDLPLRMSGPTVTSTFAKNGNVVFGLANEFT
ncbi:hypothetical protein VTK26DRAFT_8641 [Humicola hyalothermophila]